MKKLEEILGVKLIIRSNRGSTLTSEGEKFYECISRTLPELVGTIYDFQQKGGKKAVELKVGILTSLGDVLMNKYVTYFRENNNISITVYSMEKDELIRSLNNGKIDIASTFLLDDENLENFEKKLFRKDKVVYYAPNITEVSDTVGIQTMLNFSLVKYPPDNFMSKITDRYFNAVGKMPKIAAQLPSPYAIIRYCKVNATGGLVTEPILNELEISSENVCANIEPPYYLKAFLLYKKENPKYRAIKLFADYVIKLNKNRN